MSDEKRMDTALLAENDENTAAEENALVMKLDKPFTFEGQTYTEVDLSGLEDTTAADLQAVGRFVTKKNPAANPATVEITPSSWRPASPTCRWSFSSASPQRRQSS